MIYQIKQPRKILKYKVTDFFNSQSHYIYLRSNHYFFYLFFKHSITFKLKNLLIPIFYYFNKYYKFMFQNNNKLIKILKFRQILLKKI